MNDGLDAAWEKARTTWSSYVKLRPPSMLDTKPAIKKAGMDGELARFGMADYTIEVNMEELRALDLEPLLDVVLAHEVGHHVLVPGNLLAHARLTSFALPFLGTEGTKLMVNIFADLLVNDHLFTMKGLAVDEVYRRIRDNGAGSDMGQDGATFWNLYMRVYEVLWTLPKGHLTRGDVGVDIERDARLAARVVRSHSGRWFLALKNLAFIFKQYLPSNPRAAMAAFPLIDSISAGEGALDKLWGLATMEGEESGRPEELQYDGALGELLKDGARTQGQQSQARTPQDYLQTIDAIGAGTDRTKSLVQYYTELAFPYLVSFPTTTSHTSEPIIEGTEAWTFGDDVMDIDIMETLQASPVVFPGLTTRRLVHGEDAGTDATSRPVDVDIYMDTSGSMGHPATSTSMPTIAAFIIVLSALRAGASVQATSWSGPGQAVSTKGFSRDKQEILGTILYFWGDGTMFPCQVLERYERRDKDAPPVHLIVISDDDIHSMFEPYTSTDAAGKEVARSGMDTTRMAMQKGKAEGSILLNTGLVSPETMEAIASLGLAFHGISDWAEIITFARDFSRKHFSSPE